MAIDFVNSGLYLGFALSVSVSAYIIHNVYITTSSFLQIIFHKIIEHAIYIYQACFETVRFVILVIAICLVTNETCTLVKLYTCMQE